MADDIVVERHVPVGPETVFGYLRDPERWTAWQGTEAQIDFVPGGTWRVNVTGEGFASGRLVEIVENERVVFTWGWEHGPSVPPGSTTVAIELIPDGEGTLIRLTHSGLPADQIEIHRYGWEHYVPRLAAVSQGLAAGPNTPGGADGS